LPDRAAVSKTFRIHSDFSALLASRRRESLFDSSGVNLGTNEHVPRFAFGELRRPSLFVFILLNKYV